MTDMNQDMGKTRDPETDVIRRNLQKFREEAGYTQQEAALLAEEPIDSLRRWERNGGIKSKAILKLAALYGRDARDFRLANPPSLAIERQPVAFASLHNVSAAVARRIQDEIAKAGGELRLLKVASKVVPQKAAPKKAAKPKGKRK